MNDTRKLYAISFDLEQKALDEFYDKSRRSAYRELGKFLHQNGYEHKEGSVYHSNKEQTSFEFLDMIKKMDKSLPWLKSCVKEMHQTVIQVDEIIDIKSVLQSKESSNQMQKRRNPIKDMQSKNPIKRVVENGRANNKSSDLEK